MKVLFVCTQNVFRSFSAEKLLQLYLLKQKNTTIFVSSAGIEAYPDTPFSWTVEKLQKLGVKNINHNQQKVTQQLVAQQNIIICMTKSHQQILQDEFSVKSFLFNELAFGKKKDLKDNIETNTTGNHLENFVLSTIQKIAQGIPKIYEKISQKL